MLLYVFDARRCGSQAFLFNNGCWFKNCFFSIIQLEINCNDFLSSFSSSSMFFNVRNHFAFKNRSLKMEHITVLCSKIQTVANTSFCSKLSLPFSVFMSDKADLNFWRIPWIDNRLWYHLFQYLCWDHDKADSHSMCLIARELFYWMGICHMMHSSV